jgi:hypothetical protein
MTAKGIKFILRCLTRNDILCQVSLAQGVNLGKNIMTSLASISIFRARNA